MLDRKYISLLIFPLMLSCEPKDSSQSSLTDQRPQGRDLEDGSATSSPEKEGASQSLVKKGGSQSSVKEGGVYRDPQGYFEILLPTGWLVTDEYASDPRGKVLLTGPDGLKWRIIAGAGTTRTIDDLRNNAQQAKNRLPSLRIREGAVNDWKAIIVEGDIQGEYNRMLNFIVGGEAHSFAFFGQSRVLDQSWDTLVATMRTYIPIVRSRSEEERKRQSLAHWIRLTTLFYESGDAESARASLDEAAKLSPDDSKVVELRGKIPAR